MSRAKETLIDVCEKLVEKLEEEIKDADSFDLFEMVREGLMADYEPQDVIDEIKDHYILGTSLSWREE